MPSKAEQDQQLRDDVSDLKITIQKVIEPTLNTVADNVQRLADARYLTEKDAKDIYATKEELSNIDERYRDKFKFWAKWAAVIIGLILSAIVSIAVAIFNKKVIGS